MEYVLKPIRHSPKKSLDSRQGIERNHRPSQWNRCLPRPDACARCGKSIAPDEPVYYDRLHAILTEAFRQDGTSYFIKTVGGFCSNDCLYARREEMLRPARERNYGKPSP